MREYGIVLLVAGLLVVGGTEAQGDEESIPGANRIVVRGKQKLADAFDVVLPSKPKTVSRSTPGHAFLVVLDVTPYTAAAEPKIAEALIDLDDEPRAQGSWRLARLGERPMPSVGRPGALAPVLSAVLSEDTSVVATIPALAKTIQALPEKGATIVYLADWHFEDDVRLEPFIKSLKKRGHVFHVIGSEACFDRAWTDGFFPPDRGTWRRDGSRKDYADAVGRSPFGKEDVAAPWHGGDTAWPHLPMHFGGTHWVTKFPADVAPPPERRKPVERDRYGNPKDGAGGDGEKDPDADIEDLQDRREEDQDEQALERYWFPLSSGFGPYPLMRAAAVTGGRYVLWSWNPSGRSDLTYDYARVNLFAPDLRSRKTIHGEIRSRPLAMALLDVWHAISNEKIAIAISTPPLAKDGRKPLEMVEARGEWFLAHSWETPRDHKVFLVVVKRYRDAVVKAIARLDDVLRTAPTDGPDRRYHADALLLRHILLVKKFQLGEALAAGKTCPENAWDDENLVPTLDPETFLRQEDDPEMVIPEDIEVHDKALGEEVVKARARHLARFAGTPFGELVARNPVLTYRVRLVPYGRGVPTRETPSESDGEGPSTPPRAPGSGPGGPVTGR
jgi:hypothetical protein